MHGTVELKLKSVYKVRVTNRLNCDPEIAMCAAIGCKSCLNRMSYQLSDSSVLALKNICKIWAELSSSTSGENRLKRNSSGTKRCKIRAKGV